MNVYEQITRDASVDRRSFRDYADVFFQLNNFEMGWSSVSECEGILAGADEIADNLRNYEGEELYARMLSLGSVLGEAFLTVTEGFWMYNPEPERWVISFLHQDGVDVTANVFAKLEKYLEHGSEDSLTYFFSQARAPLPFDTNG